MSTMSERHRELKRRRASIVEKMGAIVGKDDDDDKPMEFWERFVDENAEPKRGFYACHPVKALKPAAVVAARCSDPALKMPDGAEAPYIALGPAGKGRVVYLGSAEIWRLSRASEHAHERFWTKLIAYAAQK